MRVRDRFLSLWLVFVSGLRSVIRPYTYNSGVIFSQEERNRFLYHFCTLSQNMTFSASGYVRVSVAYRGRIWGQNSRLFVRNVFVRTFSNKGLVSSTTIYNSNVISPNTFSLIGQSSLGQTTNKSCSVSTFIYGTTSYHGVTLASITTIIGRHAIRVRYGWFCIFRSEFSLSFFYIVECSVIARSMRVVYNVVVGEAGQGYG